MFVPGSPLVIYDVSLGPKIFLKFIREHTICNLD